MKRVFSIVFFAGLCLLTNAQFYESIVERFDNNTKGWTICDSINSSASILNNSYTISSSSESAKEFFSTFIIDPNYDYNIDISYTILQAHKKAQYGFIWGKYLDRDFLELDINTKRKFTIRGKLNDKKFLVKKWTKSRKIKKKSNSNTLSIKKKGRTIKYYINHKRIYTSDNYPLAGTELGFILKGNITLKADYIKVNCLKKQLYLVADPVNGNVLQNLGPKVNTEYSERGPVISPDGKTLYITRAHPENIQGVFTDDIWITTLDSYNEWNELIHAPYPLNNEGNNFVISVSPDGNSLLLGNTYKRDGSADKSGISLSTKRDGSWQVPKKQHIKNYKNIDPYGSFFLSSDGTKLIICAENEDSYGDLDLFISFLRKPEHWSEPVNMGKSINTFASDFSPFLAPDGKTLYFSSYGHKGYGSSDVFMSKRLDDTWVNWSEPLNLGPEINTKEWDAYYCTTAQGDYAYMVSSKSDISFGLEDIFKIEAIEAAKPEPVVLVGGYTYNKKTNERINAEIRYENLNNEQDEGIAYSSISDGYKLIFPKGSSYGFRAISDGFYAVSQNIDLSNLAAFEEKQVNLYLIPIEKGQTVRLNNIFFEFDKATLQSQSHPELNRLINLLSQNPEISILISGHTDDKGAEDYNLTLSQNRAMAVMQYLVDNGIKPNRVTSNGFGESMPIADNETEEGRQLNRRVEFVIL